MGVGFLRPSSRDCLSSCAPPVPPLPYGSRKKQRFKIKGCGERQKGLLAPYPRPRHRASLYLSFLFSEMGVLRSSPFYDCLGMKRMSACKAAPCSLRVAGKLSVRLSYYYYWEAGAPGGRHRPFTHCNLSPSAFSLLSRLQFVSLLERDRL